MYAPTNELRGKRFGVFGKGGAGKSTVVVALARALVRRGYEVCVVDADSTNAGLARALGFAFAPRPLMQRFGGTVFTGGRVTCPVDDPTRLPGRRLDLAALEDAYVRHQGQGLHLVSVGKITEDGPGAGCDGPVAKVARDLEVTLDGHDVVTLLDFKAGFEDLARGVITTIDWAVVVVDPTTASVDMMAHLDDVVRRIRAGAPPATEHLGDEHLVDVARSLYRDSRVQGTLCVLNKISDAETRSYLEERLARHEVQPIAAFPEDRGIRRSWLRGESLSLPALEAEADRVIAALEGAGANAAVVAEYRN